YQVEYHDFLNKFNKAMEYLPTTQRKIVTLSKIYQFSNKEIVEKLSLSEQTVKNQLSLGLKTLREKLGIAYFFYILFFC
ncbi:MAG: sigma-70 region 4 domain-containing protein, partial [Bacteroides intestinalis]|nr:sigma-70 region 4 domain-containing protein [Bacteroides intestinalis]